MHRPRYQQRLPRRNVQYEVAQRELCTHRRLIDVTACSGVFRMCDRGRPQWDPGASPGRALTDEVPPEAEAYLLITFDVLGEKKYQ